MRPEALEVLKGSDLILHAGDVGRDEVLEALEAIAPLVAIRGNIDKTGRAATLPDVKDLEFLGHSFYMLHDVKTRHGAAGPLPRGHRWPFPQTP